MFKNLLIAMDLSPAVEINRVAKGMDDYVIVAGTHGESLAKEFLPGSEVHRSTIPVLVVPAHP